MQAYLQAIDPNELERTLIKLRIQHAAELLRDGVSLQKTSEYCGFADIHHFSKTFKSEMGIAPGHYKRTSASDMAPN
ncbi:helix-turn-helix domain-containing protein [Cohnella soli]|uniref:Helix-turn-helix domain-containing protein n=1 Tax=Cohnella soli TaxID=425005 RepID=A0ABW0HRG9_9BACL